MSEKEDETSGLYKVGDPPHIHIGFDKNQLMLKTFLLMSIIAYASVMVMGLQALFHILIALGTVLIVHGTMDSYQKWRGINPTYDSPASPLVAGMIVGLCMPIAAPYLVTAVVAFLTMFVFKYMQGKYFDHKYLNPAATSKSVLFLALAGVFRFVDSEIAARVYHPHHQELDLLSAEGFEGAMWIFRGETVPLLGAEVSATQGLFFWQTHGWIGGASGVVVLIVGIVAAYWLRYKWRIILSTLGTMTILAVGTGLYLGGDPLLRVAFHVFTGSVIFMAFFMATEPQSTPMPENSQYIFGISLAILTFVLQIYNVVGGSLYALVIMNMATPLLDMIVIKSPYGHRESKGGG